MFRSVAALIAVLATLLLALPAAAQWKWKDKSGHTQYSDLPPPLGTPEQDILARPGAQRPHSGVVQAPTAASGIATAAASGAASNALVPRTVDPALEAKRQQAEAEQAAKAKADEARVAAARADNCKRARNQLTTLDSGIRLARANDKGEREVLDDQQRAAESRRMKDVIAADCK